MPPTTVRFMLPVFPALQLTSTCVSDNVGPLVLLMFAVSVLVQLLKSVTVTVYTPAAIAFISSVIAALLHTNV